MKNIKRVEHIVKQVRFHGTAETHQRLFQAVCGRLGTEEPERTENPKNSLWRMIMKSKITRYSAAAMLLLGFSVAGFIFIGPGIQATYAIAQTIEALKEVRSVHVFGTTRDDKPLEAWAKVNPQTGKNDYIRISIPEDHLTMIRTPEKTVTINTLDKSVQIAGPDQLTCDYQLNGIFCMLLVKVEDLKVSTVFDNQLNKSVIRIKGILDRMKCDILVDAESKLPVRAEVIDPRWQEGEGQSGWLLKTLYDFTYNENFSASVFDQTPPEGYEVTGNYSFWILLNDPNLGMPIGALNETEAAKKIARDYLLAISREDWDWVYRLRPLPGGPSAWKEKNGYAGWKGCEIVTVSDPYRREGCGVGPIVPCQIKQADGSNKTHKIVVKFREDGKCVITGIWLGE